MYAVGTFVQSILASRFSSFRAQAFTCIAERIREIAQISPKLGRIGHWSAAHSSAGAAYRNLGTRDSNSLEAVSTPDVRPPRPSALKLPF